MIRVVLAALFLGVFASGASARTGTTVVYPTGAYPADVDNVQAAVDRGGAVLLKARSVAGVRTAFDFGPPEPDSGFVGLSRDVELVGERTGTAVATIDGGFLPVRSFAAITMAVRGIDFEGALYGAIFAFEPTGADIAITGNRIVDVVGDFAPCCGTFGEAIVVGGARVVVSDNVVEDVAADYGLGISEFNSTGKVEILRNRVRGTSVVAIECTRNKGVVRIVQNDVQPGPTVNGFGGFGIEINGTGAYHVERNDVLVEAPGGVGIAAVGIREFDFGPVVDAVIERNHVMLRPVGDIGGELLADGIDLAGLVSGASVRKNKVDGPGYWALGLYGIAFPADNPNADVGFNRFVDNNLVDFRAAFADAYLDTASHDNLVKGRGGTAVDQGANNRIVGFAGIVQAAGAGSKAPRSSDASASRQPLPWTHLAGFATGSHAGLGGRVRARP